MHILSAQYRSEFLATPELVRLIMAHGDEGLEPTLLIKSSTLTLKYLLQTKKMKLVVLRVAKDWLAYGIEIQDDPNHPALLWSLLEHPNEMEAFRKLMSSPKCNLFLFNELALNVAWCDLEIAIDDDRWKSLILNSTMHPEGDESALEMFRQEVETLDSTPPYLRNGFILALPEIQEWNEIKSTYITNGISHSLISVFDQNEGNQQEEVALWLLDNFAAEGAYKGPQIHEHTKVRELTDILLSHEFGAILVESKALSILSRDDLPDREKLTRTVVKHVNKATSQLIGAVKNIKRGLPISDNDGIALDIERSATPHAIILIPDLSLINGSADFGRSYLKDAFERSEAIFHILDPVELLRVVQAAEIISERSESTTPIMALDYYLVERFKIAVKTDTPDFNFLLKTQD